MNSSAPSEEGQAQVCKNEGIGTGGGKWLLRGWQGPACTQPCKLHQRAWTLSLYLVRIEKFMNSSSKGINMIMFGQRSWEIYKAMRSAIFLFKILSSSPILKVVPYPEQSLAFHGLLFSAASSPATCLQQSLIPACQIQADPEHAIMCQAYMPEETCSRSNSQEKTAASHSGAFSTLPRAY